MPCCRRLPASRSALPRPRPSPPSSAPCSRPPSRPAARASFLSTRSRKRNSSTPCWKLPRLIARRAQGRRPDQKLAVEIAKARDILYLGRGQHYPIALEGALKLKEISYIHAEGYAAGELKHGPIALIDEETPVIMVAPHDHLFEKSLSNLQEVAARRGRCCWSPTRDGIKQAGKRLGRRSKSRPAIG